MCFRCLAQWGLERVRRKWRRTKHEKHAHMGVFLVFGMPLFSVHPLQSPSCQTPKTHPYGCVFCVQHIFCLCQTPKHTHVGVFLMFSPILVTTFLGNSIFRYILFKYICGVIDIIICLFELFYLAPFWQWIYYSGTWYWLELLGTSSNQNPVRTAWNQPVPISTCGAQ